MPGLFYRGPAPDDEEDDDAAHTYLLPRPLFLTTSDTKRIPLRQIAASNRLNVRNEGNGDKLAQQHGSIGFELAFHLGSAHGSAESEHDLAAMVHDFLENGSCGSDFPETSDGDGSVSHGSKLFETLQALKFHATPKEADLLRSLTKLSLSIKEIDLVCLSPSVECKGACIRRLLVKQLRLSGYDAAICTSKWPNSGKVPGGEYEFIDVLFDEGDEGAGDRLIVDIDFQSQFQIARPTHSYMAALMFLPVIFVGTRGKLVQTLQVMADAAKLSLRQNSMHLPPWRTLDYMNAKWMSPCERDLVDIQSGICRGPGKSHWKERSRAKQCVEQLRHLKLCIAAETDKPHISKTTTSERKVVFISKTRRSIVGSPYAEKNSFGKAPYS